MTLGVRKYSVRERDVRIEITRSYSSTKMGRIGWWIDDIKLVGRNVQLIKDTLAAWQARPLNFGLKVNESKTKCMLAAASAVDTFCSAAIQLGATSFKVVSTTHWFVYLSSLAYKDKNVSNVTLGIRSLVCINSPDPHTVRSEMKVIATTVCDINCDLWFSDMFYGKKGRTEH